ncbi:MAG: trigger factor [Eubacteriaceae bacterium]|nr:trigger factor [Eubacteriaceae bacterium]
MKATLISKENNEAKLTMEFTADELEKAVVAVYQSGKDNFEIDGFRKGKAPRSIIEKKYGENVFVDDAVNELLNKEYPAALGQLEIDVIDSPRVEFSKVEKGNDFTATVTVATYPEFEVKDYKGVEIEKTEGECKEEDVAEEMENLRKRNARMVEVERPAENGDMVLLDYAGSVDGVEFEGGKAENYPLKLGSNSFIPGFEEQLVGTSKGEDKDVVVTFPEEYHAENLAGKEAVFKCKVHEIKVEELPELDDEFAKDTSEFDTLEELKKNTEEQLVKSKAAQAENKMKDDALGKVYEANDIDIPEVMIQDEINNMVNEMDQQLRSQGMDLEKYLEYMGKNVSEFRDEIKDDARKRVKTRMIVGAIADAEEVTASEEEIEKELELMAIQYGMELEKIKEVIGTQNIGYLERDIKMKKAVDLIYDNAVIK